MKEFSVNSTFLYCVAAIVIAFVLLQSAVFLVRAWKRARTLGIEAAALKRIAMSSAVFTIAPAVAILLGVITLSKALGLPLPWLRLSVVGALTYEPPPPPQRELRFPSRFRTPRCFPPSPGS